MKERDEAEEGGRLPLFYTIGANQIEYLPFTEAKASECVHCPICLDAHRAGLLDWQMVCEGRKDNMIAKNGHLYRVHPAAAASTAAAAARAAAAPAAPHLERGAARPGKSAGRLVLKCVPVYFAYRLPPLPAGLPVFYAGSQKILIGNSAVQSAFFIPLGGNPRGAAIVLSSRAASDAYAKGPASVRIVPAGVLERRSGTARGHLRSITRRPARAQALAARKAGWAAKQQAAVCTQHGARLFVPRQPRTSA
ncbi:hypothetical protein T492DRAFT_1152085 [Pavlovales sp. CCMP2436]|nr:hypothetical protein T492DRAFT_1152085 [Pavlovales sp. CCMP2436]